MCKFRVLRVALLGVRIAFESIDADTVGPLE